MTQEMMIMAAILVAVILLTFFVILFRYRKCKNDEVLVVYRKTGVGKQSAKLYHSGVPNYIINLGKEAETKKVAELNPSIAIQYKMVDQWKEIAGEQVKAFKHINLDNITVFDGGNGDTNNFLSLLIKIFAPNLGVFDKLSINEIVKNITHLETTK